jgi:hypothetical protein
MKPALIFFGGGENGGGWLGTLESQENYALCTVFPAACLALHPLQPAVAAELGPPIMVAGGSPQFPHPTPHALPRLSHL